MLPGLFNAVEHEIGSTIGFMDISRSVENIAKWVGQGHGVKQRVVAAAPFPVLVEAYYGALGTTLVGYR